MRHGTSKQSDLFQQSVVTLKLVYDFGLWYPSRGSNLGHPQYDCSKPLKYERRDQQFFKKLLNVKVF